MFVSVAVLSVIGEQLYGHASVTWKALSCGTRLDPRIDSNYLPHNVVLDLPAASRLNHNSVARRVRYWANIYILFQSSGASVS